jgi:hypothetical protein
MSPEYFGVCHYFTGDLDDRPQIGVEALRRFARWHDGARTSFHGMLAGSDRFSRTRTLSDGTLGQLATDLKASVYTDVIGYAGPKVDPQATLSFAAIGAGGRPREVQYICASTGDLALADLERRAAELWTVFAPLYGISMFARSYSRVAAELSCVPIGQMGEAAEPGYEERLLRLQELKPLFGKQTRGGTWGTYLGSALVGQLGGVESVQRGAPVAAVMELQPEGLYLRLTSDLLVIEAPDLEVATSSLSRFLAPVTPKELVDVEPRR